MGSAPSALFTARQRFALAGIATPLTRTIRHDKEQLRIAAIEHVCER